MDEVMDEAMISNIFPTDNCVAEKSDCEASDVVPVFERPRTNTLSFRAVDGLEI